MIQAAGPGSLGTGQWTFNGGSLQLTSGGTYSPSSIIPASGGGTLDIMTNSVTISGPIVGGSGSGPLTKVGSGPLTLTAAGTISNVLNINAGTLSLAGAIGR